MNEFSQSELWFQMSVIDSAKPKLDTKCRSGILHFICFATFLWIILSFCIDILTTLLTIFINKVIILFHIVALTLGAFLVWKFNKLAARGLHC